jgi:copper chaperone CopZ
MGIQNFAVTGMTCEHCVRAVTAELSKLPSIERVEVDLSSGVVTVSADRELDESEIAAAIKDAGYELVHDESAQPR